MFGFDRYVAIMYLQCAIDLGTCLLISALSGRLFGRRSAKAALWLAALCPFTAIYAAAPLTETLTLFTIALTFYSLERWQSASAPFNRWLLAITAAMAYSVLLRPEQGLLPATVIPAMAWIVWQKSVRQKPVWQKSARRLSLLCFRPVAIAALCVVLPARALGHQKLAHLPRHPATRPTQRHRPRRDRPHRLSALVSHLGHRLRLH
ncbi:glycosyltransferase family 39 protein [Tunturiibacter empetritectus]|uniref:glycosyltransferase family 39 protein n=1 Tax=Tunturiibacter empetritectus TaxID=3069691 RepID=UPI003D9BC8D1